ncbi:3-mercaptopyruvate sulfurtransferase-like [Acipenser ruthenus]|uniref:3-mercaptopyruvate sulfurtransferase-like n=1 Tax=Acipenser ruthenus TaxID=7906 RepID=UPI002740D724|nr:3-mercaptopyruvate sulfurtransferase-like isoform X2 [Acipenser ruthenus]XP_058875388.1 3-mercaptopyruvate sulfurtransferase-like isoform X2 [Acipenser ruthenus]XP_058877540.1 3-mercaptopyruvate sulfurtransferase-like [Acipenser ruthenus]
MALQIRALVTAKWLWDAVGTRTRSNPRVLDASWYIPAMNRDPKKEFTQPGHIPGSSPFDIDSCSDTASPYPHMLPSEGFFAEYVGNLGIGTRTHVVVYDASEFGSFSAPRVWWMFRAFGHGSVSVLDGGLKAWVREGYPLTGEYTKPEPVEFRANLDRSRVKSYQDVLENLESKRFQLLDVKTPGRYNGTEPEPMEGIKPGHIPGSVNIPFYEFLSASGCFRTPAELRALFRNNGVDLLRPLAVTCGSGVTACHAVLAALQCGSQDVTVFDGSWSEWFTRARPELVLSEGKGKRF